MHFPQDPKVHGSNPNYTLDFSIRDPASPPCCKWYRTSVLETCTEDTRDWGPILVSTSMYCLRSTCSENCTWNTHQDLVIRSLIIALDQDLHVLKFFLPHSHKLHSVHVRDFSFDADVVRSNPLVGIFLQHIFKIFS